MAVHYKLLTKIPRLYGTNFMLFVLDRWVVCSALAIESLKEALNLTSWLGDPCVCTPYDWITCTNDPFPRIETL